MIIILELFIIISSINFSYFMVNMPVKLSSLKASYPYFYKYNSEKIIFMIDGNLRYFDLYGNFLSNQTIFSYSYNIVSNTRNTYTVFASSKNTCLFKNNAGSHFSYLTDNNNFLYDCDYLDVVWLNSTEFFLVGLYNSKLYKFYKKYFYQYSNLEISTIDLCDNNFYMIRCFNAKSLVEYSYCLYNCDKKIYGIFINNTDFSKISSSNIEFSILGSNSVNVKYFNLGNYFGYIACNYDQDLNFNCIKFTLDTDTYSTNIESNLLSISENKCLNDIRYMYVKYFVINDSDYIALYCCIASIEIICHKINSNFVEIETFSIDTNLGGTNSFFYMVQAISKSLFLFMFENDGYSYSYYLYIPYCEDTTEEMVTLKSITLSLTDYFHFYTNDTTKINFYETNTNIEDYGYITINSDKVEINTLYIISEGDVISFVSNTTNSNENLIIYYYLINSEGFYTVNNCSIKINIQPCYTSCYKCSDIGNSITHNCETCKEDYYNSPTDDTLCYNISEKADNWYLDEENQIFALCSDACLKCFGPEEEKETNCYNCAEGYYLTVDSSSYCRIPEDIEDNYYFDGTIYQKCYINCAKCFGGYSLDTATYNQNCSKCLDEYYFEFNTNNCYDISYLSQGYYLNTETFYPCYERCQTCSIGYDSENDNQNCNSCKDSYYFIYNTKNCYTIEEAKTKGYYLKNSEYFLPCYINCNTCSAGFNEDENNQNCLTCKSNYYILNDTNNCYNSDFYTYNYYLNAEDYIIYPCYESCKKCNIGYDLVADFHNCLECKENYYFKKDTNNCYNSTIKTEGYYLNENNFWEKCSSNCETCNEGPSDTSNNCLTCKNSIGLYLVNDINNCGTTDLFKIGYYLDNNILYKCYENCYNCTTKSDNENMNCDLCKDENYHKIFKTNNCYNDDILEKGYIYHEISGELFYIQCYDNCKSCSDTSDDINDQKCTVCKDNYYFEYDTKNCYDENYYNKGYYLNSTDNFWRKCHESCSTCTTYYENGNTNCVLCNNDEGYYSFEDNITLCHNESNKPNNYYLNRTSNTFIKCYSTCLTCSNKGNDSEHMCINCLNDLVFYKNNCLTICPKDYFNYENYCYSECPNNYYSYSITRQCVSVCPENSTLSYNKKNCVQNGYNLNITSNELIDLISNNLLSYANNQSAIIGENSVIQVYGIKDSESIAKIAELEKLSIIQLNECYEILKKSYNIKENEDIIMLKVDENKTDSNTNIISFYLYDYNGNQLNLSLCENNNITILTPIINTNNLDLTTSKNLYINNNIDVFNSQEDFFNDFCHSYTLNDSSDITLNDRQKYYQNVSFCSDECYYNNVNYSNLYVNCECSTNNANISNIKTYFKILRSGFINTNIKIIKCYKLFFNSKYVNKNLGFWISLGLLISELIIFIRFNIKGLQPIINFMFIFKPKEKENKKNIFEELRNANNENEFIENNNDNIEKTIDNKSNSVKNNPPLKKNKKKKNNNNINNKSQFILVKSFYKNKYNKHKGEFIIESEANILENEDEEFKKNLNKENKSEIINEFPLKKNKKNLTNSNIPNSPYNVNNNENIKNNNSTLQSNNEENKTDKNSIFKYSNIPFITIENNNNNNNNNENIEKDIISNNNNDNIEKDINTNNNIEKLGINNQKILSEKIKDQVNSYSLKSSDDKLYPKIKSRKLSVISGNYELENLSNISIPEDNFSKEKIFKYEEYNKFSYNESIQYDNRTFLQIYWDYLSNKHIIINTFFAEAFLELRLIKIFFYIITIGLDFTLNAIFYNDDYISDVYNNNGKLNFIKAIPKSIYSCIVNFFISFFLKQLSSSKDNFINLIKNIKNVKKYKKFVNKTIFCLKIKLFFFFGISFALLLFFLYFNTVFCAVYPNNQVYWVYSGLESIFIGLFLPFVFCFIVSIMRYISIKKRYKILFCLSYSLNLII